MTGLVRESAHSRGNQEGKSTFVVSGFEPRLPAWHASALSIVICPWGDEPKGKYLAKWLRASRTALILGRCPGACAA